MPAKPNILTAVCGRAPTAISKSHRDYLDWFAAPLQERVNLVPWDVQAEMKEPALSDYQGLLITGSEDSATQPQPWMEVVVETIRQASEGKVPVLGVCFGHQLVGCAFGAPTIAAPETGELGTLEIDLNAEGLADPLFAGCGSRLSVQLTHHDQVAPDSIAYSNRLRVLGSSANTAVQALAGGDYVRSVQFHPEFDAAIMSAYLELEGQPPHAKPCPQSTQILHNWLDGWVL